MKLIFLNFGLHYKNNKLLLSQFNALFVARSHSDIRPYGCKQCNFNFKTKGNLTKHLQSKTHRRRIVEKEKRKIAEQDSDSDHDRLEIASLSGTASTFSNDPLSDDEW